MSQYNILVSPFKLNYWNKWTFAPYSHFPSFTCTQMQSVFIYWYARSNKTRWHLFLYLTCEVSEWWVMMRSVCGVWKRTRSWCPLTSWGEFPSRAALFTALAEETCSPKLQDQRRAAMQLSVCVCVCVCVSEWAFFVCVNVSYSPFMTKSVKSVFLILISFHLILDY